MKLYIPTSTLNFNNILSSESISPKQYYLERSFGYPRWTEIPENPYTNSIILYNDLCGFERPKSEIEDHPLLIEIEVDNSKLSDFIPHGDMFLSDHTIYLSPFTTRFLFFSDKEYNITLSLSDSSIDTKLLRLYRKQMKIVSMPDKKYRPIESDEELQQFNASGIQDDKRRNRVKGLLYGYYIGQLLSADKPLVHKLNLLRQIQNILMAIYSNTEKKATELQFSKLQNLCRELNKETDLYKELYNCVSDDKRMCKILDVVEKYSLNIKGEYIKAGDLLNELFISDKNIGTLSKVRDWISSVTEDMNRASKPLSVESKEIICADGELKELNVLGHDEEQESLFITWVDEIISSDKYNGKISLIGADFATAMTRKAKEICHVEWKGSKVEIALNGLRRHLGGEKYEHAWGDDILSYFAAIVTKGEEWDKLLCFMQGKEMTDYRLPFALYGVLNGFADLPRDFTDVLLKQDSKYLVTVYNEFQKQIFGTTAHIDDKPVNQQTSFLNSDEDMPDFSSAMPDVEDRKIQKEDLGRQTFDWVFSILKDRYNGSEKNKDNFLEHYGKVLDDLCSKYEGEELIRHIESTEGIKNHKTQWESCRKKIVDTLRSEGIKYETDSENMDGTGTLNLQAQPGDKFYCDDNAFYVLYPFLPKGKKVLERFKDDLTWFQGECKKGDESQYGYCSAKNSTSYLNINVIKHYRKYLNNKKNGGQKWLQQLYKDVDVDKIINKLHEFYK